MISKKTKYGIKALIYIYHNRNEIPIATKKIATAENISYKFLESILLSLKKAGILASKKGKEGGYYLLKSPHDIMMSDVIRILGGPIAMVPCVSLNFYEKCDDCPYEEGCGVHQLMLEVRNSTLKILESKSLHDMGAKTVEN